MGGRLNQNPEPKKPDQKNWNQKARIGKTRNPGLLAAEASLDFIRNDGAPASVAGSRRQ
jgi:hypothetical protein